MPSPHDADLAYAKSGGDLSFVPAGPYCYRILEVVDGTAGPPVIRTKTCPYWGCREVFGEGISGYCAHLKSGDWEEDGPMLLFDRVKECGVNEATDKPFNTLHEGCVA